MLGEMGNSARRFCGGGFEETTLSVASPSAPPGESSAFHTALEDCLSSLDAVALGDSAGAVSPVEPKSEYFSARVEAMIQTRNQFSSSVEHAIAHSKAHWSEVTGPSELSDTSESSSMSNSIDNSYYEEEKRENEEVFAELMNDSRWRLCDGYFFLKASAIDMTLGKKIAEGGQAEIFEVIFPPATVKLDHVLKVFKRGLRLSMLQQGWPSLILEHKFEICAVQFGLLLDDGRFGFLMLKCSCDLRTLIDKAMVEKNHQGPPISYKWNNFSWPPRFFMSVIAEDMVTLHNEGIMHRDLKATNILIFEPKGDFCPFVVDYECSLGAVGTGFWRAPEVLLALRQRKAFEFSKAMDVYSYGMTCFELVTGLLPFEGELCLERASYDLVIAGQRPKLPSNLDLTLKNLIESCWHPNPECRPSFPKIVEILDS